MEDVNEQEVETEAVNVRLLGHEKPNTITFTRVPAQGPDSKALGFLEMCSISIE